MQKKNIGNAKHKSQFIKNEPCPLIDASHLFRVGCRRINTENYTSAYKQA